MAGSVIHIHHCACHLNSVPVLQLFARMLPNKRKLQEQAHSTSISNEAAKPI